MYIWYSTNIICIYMYIYIERERYKICTHMINRIWPPAREAGASRPRGVRAGLPAPRGGRPASVS